MADLRNSRDNSYYAKVNNHPLSKNESTKRLILDSAVQRFLADFGIDLSGEVVIPINARIVSVTGGVGYIDIEYIGTATPSGDVGEFILEVG